MTEQTRSAPPRAMPMLESLRGLGYSTESALADLIDNCISANAKQVRVNFFWQGTTSHISILDDGCGMSDAELESAMRLGDRNPLDVRANNDLGRFGMGLKTASLSQCRRLTVASSKNEVVSCLRWDLDELAKNPEGGWLLFEGPAAASKNLVSVLDGKKNATYVLLEVMDRIVTNGFNADNFHDLMDRVQAHLAMVFHRLLEASHTGFQIFLNDRLVAPWDPFMSGHYAKSWTSPVTSRQTEYGTVNVQCHVLPHQDKLGTASDIYAGPAGWTAQQGFYLYRNERLLVAGGWLGLGVPRAWNRDEVYKLARIRLDIANTADGDWKINVLKSTARPPLLLRPWLTRLAEDTRKRARRVFAFRGIPAPARGHQPIALVWRNDHLQAGTKYRIEEAHPSIAAVLNAAGDQRPMVLAMLRVIEETVPVQRIWLQTAEKKETPRTDFEGEPNATVVEVANIFFRDLVERKGLSVADARLRLSCSEPFQKYPDLIMNLRIEK